MKHGPITAEVPAELAADITAGILVGGMGRRLGGVDKARLRRLSDEQSFVGHLVTTVTPLVHTVVLLGRTGQHYPEVNCTLVADTHPGCGPMGGLRSLLGTSKTAWSLLLACDLPALSADVLAAIFARRRDDVLAVVPRTPDAQPHPTCALYHRSILPHVDAALHCGSYSLQRLLQAVSCEWCDLPTGLHQALHNVNTPVDLAGIGSNNPRNL